MLHHGSIGLLLLFLRAVAVEAGGNHRNGDFFVPVRINDIAKYDIGVFMGCIAISGAVLATRHGETGPSGYGAIFRSDGTAWRSSRYLVAI